MPRGGADPPRMGASAVHPRAGQVRRRPGNGATDGADQGELAPGDDRRWVHTPRRASPHVSGVPARLADQAEASMSVAGVSRHLPVPAGLVSKSVSRRARWPAASGSWACTRNHRAAVVTISRHNGDRPKRPVTGHGFTGQSRCDYRTGMTSRNATALASGRPLVPRISRAVLLSLFPAPAPSSSWLPPQCRDRADNRPFETRWYRRPLIILQLDG